MNELEREIKELSECFEKLQKKAAMKVKYHQIIFNLSLPSFLFLFLFSIYPLTNLLSFSMVHSFTGGLCLFAIQQSIRSYNYLLMHKSSLKHLNSFCNLIEESINKSQLSNEDGSA